MAKTTPPPKPNNSAKFQGDQPKAPPIPCTVCQHPARPEIDAELCNASSLPAVVARFSTPTHPIKRSSLQRHRQNHLPLHPSERILVPVVFPPRAHEVPIPEPESPQDEPEPVSEPEEPAEAVAAPEVKPEAKAATAPPPYLAPTVTHVMIGKAQRIAEWQDLARRVDIIIRERGKAHASMPGGRSGLLAVREVSQRIGKEEYRIVEVAEFDRALVETKLRLGEAIARETGDYLIQVGRAMPLEVIEARQEAVIQPVVQIMPGAVANIAIGSELLPDARHRIRREYTRPAPTVGEIPPAPEAMPLSESDLELAPEAVTVIQAGELALPGLAPVLGEARPAGAVVVRESGSGAAAVEGLPIEPGEPPVTLFDGAPRDES